MANSMANYVAAESVFVKQLDGTERKRYRQKLDQLGLSEDPYVMSINGFETDKSLSRLSFSSNPSLPSVRIS